MPWGSQTVWARPRSTFLATSHPETRSRILLSPRYLLAACAVCTLMWGPCRGGGRGRAGLACLLSASLRVESMHHEVSSLGEVLWTVTANLEPGAVLNCLHVWGFSLLILIAPLSLPVYFFFCSFPPTMIPVLQMRETEIQSGWVICLRSHSEFLKRSPGTQIAQLQPEFRGPDFCGPYSSRGRTTTSPPSLQEPGYGINAHGDHGGLTRNKNHVVQLTKQTSKRPSL